MSRLRFAGEAEPGEFPRDADGHLFDPRIRQILARTGRRVEPGAEALGAVRVLAKKMHDAMERWADQHGLSEGRFQILGRLHHQPDGRMPMGELAEMLDVSPRTVTGLVDHLERDGLVRRVDDPEDRRSIYAELTAQGRERIKTVWKDAAIGQAALTRGFTASDLIQLRHLCLRLVQAIGAAEGGTRAS